jgi:hypothetical protein
MKAPVKAIGRTLGWVMVAVLGIAATVAAKPTGYGTISGVVLDPSGTPQMGASVWLISEDAGGRIVAQILSNQHGTFFTDRLKPGQYAVRVSVAGFLPAMERHVAVMSNLTTLLRVQVETVFSSLDTLRRKSDAPSEQDDWKWVLRSSTATRTILQWDDSGNEVASNTLGAELPSAQHPRALVQVTSGAVRPGSASNLPSAPATAVSYDQQIGRLGRVLVAGQMSYDRGASGSIAGVWLPSGDARTGPETIFIWRQSKFGAEGMEFEALRIDHTEQIPLGDRFLLKAGSEYIRAGIISSVSSLRPHAQLLAQLAPSLTATLSAAANPPSEEWGRAGNLESAIDELDSLPPVLFHNGSPVLQGGWHQEFSVKRKMENQSTLELAAFHDSARNQAVFGTGPAASPEFLQDAFSPAFLYDGGNSSSWGARAAYYEKLSDDWELAAIYAWAGALTPGSELSTAGPELRDSFMTSNHHSLAARVSGKIPRSSTQFSASYKWVSGTTLSRMDQFGEAAYQMDPNLHLSIRQPLPGSNGRWVALADFSNLLAQGYVSVNGQDPRMMLVPNLRSFRGGVSFQF